jgi:hypothetical protein
MKYKLRLPSFLAKDRKRQAIAAGLALFLAFVVLGSVLLATGALSGSGQAAPTPSPSAVPTPTSAPTPTAPPTEPTLIDGVLVYPEELQEMETRLPLAVMLDNLDSDARPQVNLDKADLVFEAVAEGGITRFLAVYWRNDPGVIESVRSARVYYLDWAAELDAIFVHWGFASSDGPADVPSAISRLSLRELDGFFYEEPLFERDPERAVPHNGIANSDALWDQAAKNEWGGPPAIETWTFKEDDPARARAADAATADKAELGFGGPFFSDYSVRWTYEPRTNSYLRTMGGAPHRDGESKQRIRAKNVAVMITDVQSAGDGTAHLLYRTTGKGRAVVFQDGVAVEGKWEKPDPAERTRFYDDDGNEIAFNRGQTWIEVLAVSDPLVY